MRILKKILIASAIGCLVPAALFSKTINLDQDKVSVDLKNNALNLMVFPFVIHEAKLSTETPEDFQVTSKNTSLVVLPTAAMEEQGGIF